ncbi:hypothetical protein ONE63_000101 [Megalurothrips usitatus]|uniref:BTB domain-containing protein n=1 Tax=Megalurothrips usitatus TaxID=439358 RepID=A0AAV7Y3K0_9NEOP|nr:hypothetical protein ONE63_000101 [Megalurothrips usitatus]
MVPGGAAAGSVLGHALNAERRAGSQCDVVFEVGGQPLPAHRLVVRATCPVFERMFAGEFFREKDGRVEIWDVTRAAFEKFLEFLYTEEVTDWGGCEVDLLELSDRYLVAHLRAACELRLAHMTDAVALTVLRQAPAKPVIDAALRRAAARALVAGRADVASVAGWAAFKSACPILADALDVAQEECRKGPPQVSTALSLESELGSENAPSILNSSVNQNWLFLAVLLVTSIVPKTCFLRNAWLKYCSKPVFEEILVTSIFEVSWRERLSQAYRIEGVSPRDMQPIKSHRSVG